MALMILRRLPTEKDLEATSMEAHSFLDSFNKHSVSPFVAKVEKDGDHVILDEWVIEKADWFECVEG